MPHRATSRTGRPAVGVDIGGSSVKLALLDADQGVVATSSSDRYESIDADILDSAIRAAAQRLGVDLAPVDAAGVAVPGVLDAASGALVHAVNVAGIVGVDLRRLVAASLPGVTVAALLPDAAAAGIGHWLEGRRPGRLLAVSLGTGVGAALLDDGRPVSVTSGGVGHLGQIDVGPCGRGASGGTGAAVIGPDGGRDGLEAYIGLPALRARFGDDLESRLATLPDDDAAVVALVRALRVCHAMFVPDEIALLGGVGLALGRRAIDIERLVRAGLTSVANPAWRLTIGGTAHAAAAGAASEACKGGPGSG